VNSAVQTGADLSLVEKIADAVLYEGYILYPYRPSAVKNQQRWNFGALCPKSYAQAQGGTENWKMQTECLVQPSTESKLNIKVRFLHLVSREIAQLISDNDATVNESDFEMVPWLEVDGKLFQTWQEAVERDVLVPGIELDGIQGRPLKQAFSFPSDRQVEVIKDQNGRNVGGIIRRQEAIEGEIELSVAPCELRMNSIDTPSAEASTGASRPNELIRVTVNISNRTPLIDAGRRTRDEALMRSLVSTHTILEMNEGTFVSLLDPPEDCREAASSCSNIGTFPVLVGKEGARDCMLSSPIILYDYPQIAPESAGNLYDGTEIDEILTLRIMTLTDEEKREMRGADERARQILERTETLPAEQLMKLHGAMRSLRPSAEKKS
jgi:hypothetical protein